MNQTMRLSDVRAPTVDASRFLAVFRTCRSPATSCSAQPSLESRINQLSRSLIEFLANPRGQMMYGSRVQWRTGSGVYGLCVRYLNIALRPSRRTGRKKALVSYIEKNPTDGGVYRIRFTPSQLRDVGCYRCPLIGGWGSRRGRTRNTKPSAAAENVLKESSGLRVG